MIQVRKNSFIKYFFLAGLICPGLPCISQVKWPAISQTARPWTRWWWQGSAVNKKDLTAAMQQYHEAGLGGLEITPIYGVKGHEKEFIDFLSPKWMSMLQHTLSEGKRLGLGIDMANATGWPFGGPWVTPADACREAWVKKYSLGEGGQLNEPIRFTQPAFYRSESGMKIDLATLSYPVATNKNLQALALDQVRLPTELKPDAVLAYDSSGNVLDLTAKTDASGKLNWTAPSGNWKIYALFVGYHGKLVERAAPGGEGDVIDHFSAPALTHYLQRFDSAFKGHDLSGLRSFFNDSYEVDDARGQSNWTPALFREFSRRRGYDLKPFIPLLFDRDSSDTGRRILVDYRQTISDLLLDNFTKPWQRWAALKGKMVRNQSHGSPANILDLYAVVDIPETEGADILRFKFATSTAHVTGKPLASAETATWLNEHFQSSLGDVKQAVDKYFVGGVNHIFWHGTNYSPQHEPWPGWLFYAAVHFTPANPFWKDFGALNNYVARCQSFLQEGKPDNDILLYFPFNDKIAEPGRDLLHHFDGMAGFERTTFKASAEWLLQQGYAFDLISDRQVLGLKSESGALQAANTSYKTIVLSDTKYLPVETLQQLIALARQGSTVIFHKNIPSDVPGLSKLSANQANLKQLTAALVFSTGASGVRTAAVGSGRILQGEDLEKLLDAANTKRETMADQGLQYARRSISSGHIYFISNPGRNRVNEWVPLQAKEKNIVMFDPASLAAGVAKTKTENGIVHVLLQLEPGASCILQSSVTAIAGSNFANYLGAGQQQAISGKWKLQFLKGGPVLPRDTTMPSPLVWTSLPGDAAKNFSGTANYSVIFSMPSITAKNYLLQLGEIAETAEIKLNGRKLGVLLGPSYSITIAAKDLKAGDNLLEVLVTNGMANRIADLDRRGVDWKKFYNTNFPARLPQNRGANGLFSAVNWQPKISGLSGPVTITPLKNLE